MKHIPPDSWRPSLCVATSRGLLCTHLHSSRRGGHAVLWAHTTELAEGLRSSLNSLQFLIRLRDPRVDREDACWLLPQHPFLSFHFIRAPRFPRFSSWNPILVQSPPPPLPPGVGPKITGIFLFPGPWGLIQGWLYDLTQHRRAKRVNFGDFWFPPSHWTRWSISEFHYWTK